MTYLLRLDIVDGILRSGTPTLDEDGKQGDDEAGRKPSGEIRTLYGFDSPLAPPLKGRGGFRIIRLSFDTNATVHLLQLFLCQLLSLLAVHFILLHNLINFKLLNLLFLVAQMSFVLIDSAKIRQISAYFK